MMTVFKYPLSFVGLPVVNLPEGAQILHVDMQYGLPVLWALIDEANKDKLKPRYIRIAGTGHDIESASHDTEIPKDFSGIRYINTFFANEERSLVYHAFEVIL